MVKPNIQDIHNHLLRAGIPILSVQLNRDGKHVSLVFLKTASETQQLAAQKMADEWDQEAVDAAKTTAFDTLPTMEGINEAAKVAELKAMALQLRTYIDDHR